MCTGGIIIPYLFCDIETDNSKGFGLDPFRSKVSTFQAMFSDGESKLLQDPKNLDEFEYELKNYTCVFHNAKFDCKFIKYHYGITVPTIYDTMLAEQVISGGLLAGYAKGKSLKDVTKKYCGVERDKSHQNSFGSGQELTDAQIEYLLDDLRYLPEIMKKQKAQIKKLGLEQIIEIEMKAIPAFVWLELSGINVDLEKLAEIKVQTLKEKEEAKQILRNELVTYSGQITIFGDKVGKYPNLDSNKELLESLQKKGIPLTSTADEELSKFGDNPTIKKIKEYRKATKKLSSFIETLPGFVNPATGRIHASFNQMGTVSARLTSEKPNLQQQPHDNSWRQIFTAPEGYSIVSADYSQIELRILGQVSNDKEFIKAYRNKMDLHSLTASKIFNNPYSFYDKNIINKDGEKERSPEAEKQRTMSKSVGFGIAYGIYIYGLINTLAKSGVPVTEDEAKAMIDGFYKAYPEVSTYLKNVSEKGLKDLQVRNMSGRLMVFQPPRDKQEEGGIKRESKNLPIQSLCADMIKIALGNLFPILEPMGVKFINTIHDELVMQCPDELVEDVKVILKTEMEKAGSLYLTDMPCEAEVKVAKFWKK